MDVYSVTLLVAMVGAGVAVAGTIWMRYQTDAAPATQITRVAGGLGVLLAAFALLYHRATGHRSASAQALGVIDFMRAHPAPLFTILLGAGSGWLVRHRSRANVQTR